MDKKSSTTAQIFMKGQVLSVDEYSVSNQLISLRSAPVAFDDLVAAAQFTITPQQTLPFAIMPSGNAVKTSLC